MKKFRFALSGRFRSLCLEGRARSALFVFPLLHAFMLGCMNVKATVAHARARLFLVSRSWELQLHKKRGQRRFRVEAVHGLRQQRCRRQYGQLIALRRCQALIDRVGDH